VKLERDKWRRDIFPYLAAELREALRLVTEAEQVEEIRLRAGRAPLVQTGRGEIILPGKTSPAELHQALLLMTEYSLYARDEELKRGYLSLPGGHRAGFTGRTVLEGGAVKLLRDISGINIRVAREVKGAAEKLLYQVFCSKKRTVLQTLLVSPPQAGKTTVLRDLARLLAENGFKVGIVDERSELAGCHAGVPQLDVGPRTDVLDGCPKAEGMMMLVRSMSPQVVVTDELGRPEDVAAVEEVINSGAAVLASVHGGSVEEAARRPALAKLLSGGLFERVVLLGRSRGPGTVEAVMTGEEAGRLAQRGQVAHAF